MNCSVSLEDTSLQSYRNWKVFLQLLKLLEFLEGTALPLLTHTMPP